MQATCPHISAADAQRFVPQACSHCLGYVDSDRTLMSAEAARQRYPTFASIVDAYEPLYAAHRNARLVAPARRSFGHTAGVVAKLSANLLIVLLLLPVVVILGFISYEFFKLAASGG
jgi:hypothetical protein